jgi:LPXTG-motif cell wall-anchored protein
VLQSDTDTEDAVTSQKDGTEMRPTAEDSYFFRDQEYMTKTFPKYDPTARDKLVAIEFAPGSGGYYRNALLFSTIPGLEDTAVNDILTDINTVKIASIYGGKSSGLMVELLLEDESQEENITLRLLDDSRIVEVEKSYFSAVPEPPDEILPISDAPTQDPATTQDLTTVLPQTGDGSLGLFGIITALIVSSGSLFTAAYRRRQS